VTRLIFKYKSLWYWCWSACVKEERSLVRTSRKDIAFTVFILLLRQRLAYNSFDQRFSIVKLETTLERKVVILKMSVYLSVGTVAAPFVC